MKAITIDSFGGIEKLKMGEIQIPAIADDEVQTNSLGISQSCRLENPRKIT